MYPAYLVRCGIDWVRHAEEYKDSNPYSRCEATIKTCQSLWEEQLGKPDMILLEPACVAAYWAEFFNAEDPLADEEDWRQGLIKQSGQHDSFDSWQESFKKTYAKVYKEDNIWLGVLMTSWAHTHQYEVIFVEDAWEFRPATSYLPTDEMWRLEPHMLTLANVLSTLWEEEMAHYNSMGFTVEEHNIPYLGKVESLAFDTKRYSVQCPPKSTLETEVIDVGDLVADIILPPGSDWYRHLDNVIFANDLIDITALINRTKYVFGSKRRIFELSMNGNADKAREQAKAEGWLVSSAQETQV